MKQTAVLLLLAILLTVTGCALRNSVLEPSATGDSRTEEYDHTENAEGAEASESAGTPESTERTEPVESANPSLVYPKNPAVQAVFSHEYTGDCDTYNADTYTYAEKVVFFTDGAVRDFTLLALQLEEITEEGVVSFVTDILYTYGDLAPERGWAVTMRLPETIPYYGISYTDGSGKTRVFSVNLSGRDGSVYLSEILHYTSAAD